MEKTIITKVPLDLLVDNTDNPNVLSAKDMKLLENNIMRLGSTEPPLIVPVDKENFFLALKNMTPQEAVDIFILESKQFRIVSGHHRVKAFRNIDKEQELTSSNTWDMIVITDPKFTDDDELDQLLRHNHINGKVSPAKVAELAIKRMQEQGSSVTTTANDFGISDPQKLQNLIDKYRNNLPPELAEEFDKKSKNVRDENDLIKLINTLYGKYGNTLKTGYMVFDYGGKESLWIHIEPKTFALMKKLGTTCMINNKYMDDVLKEIFTLIVNGDLDDEMQIIFDSIPDADIPKTFNGIPTKEKLDG